MTQNTHNQAILSAAPQFIGEFEIDAATLCISRQGQVFKLEPRTMALLLFLARRPDAVISREELEREVWSGLVVGYDALNNTIAKLRKAFGDNSRDPQYIRTVPKVGYQLIAKVRQPGRNVEPQFTVSNSASGPSLERKLAAILSTDVVNYSRLTGLDEEGTHRELSACLDLIKSLVENFNGRVVNSAGDAILAEFVTVSDALGCAVVAQQQLAERSGSVQDDRKMRFRIGLNLGEVIVDRNDIFGDGVIVAARLEGLSEPGGICVSGSAFDAIGNKLPLNFEFLGERDVKNVEKPVRAYQVRLKPGATIALPHKRVELSKLSQGASRRVAVVATLFLITGLASWTGWHYLNSDHLEPKVTESVAPFTGKSSIAVLPFENISDDPAQEYFADGMTDDLIADLSKISQMAVIARQSVFAYKDKPIGVEQIGKELGVHYVLEGSVKRIGGKVRINVNLIDTTNAQALWSERYESDATELFDLQNRVIDSIVAILEVKLTDQEKSTLSRLPTDNLEAYDYYQRAERRRLIAPDPDNPRDIYLQDGDAIELYLQAIELDPEFVEAYAGLALAAMEVWEFASTQVLPSEIARKMAYDAASKVRELDPKNSDALSVLALLQSTDGQHDIAIKSARQAIELDPNSSNAYQILGKVLMYAGEHEEALASVKMVLELNPTPPDDLKGLLGLAEFFNGNYQQALFWLEKAQMVQHSQHDLLMTYGELGKRDEAGILFDKIRVFTPFANLGHYRIRYAHYKREQDLEHMITALRKAGVPDNAFGFEGNPVDQLGSAELKELIAGNAWTGADYYGSDFVQQVTDEGGIAFRNSTSMLAGDAWIDGDRFCVRFSADLLGRDDCGPVYRNPDGTTQERNEYVRVALGNLYYFSLK